MKRITTLLLVFSLLLAAAACAPEVRAQRSQEEEHSGTAMSVSAPASGFTDVPENAWYRTAVEWCQAQSLLKGTSENVFSPDLVLSRGMMAALLWRQEGSPADTDGTDFTDVPESSAYADAIRWASGTKRMSGYGDGRFGPDDPVTRQQLVTVLWRSAGSPAPGQETDIPDVDAIADWAREAVRWARNRGLVTGREDGSFDPEAGVTRAEAAAFLYRYLNPETDEDPEPNPGEEESTLPYDGIYPQHEPYGKGIGAMPGRVVWAWDPDSVTWDGSGSWWETDHFDEQIIRRMVDGSIASLGGKTTAREGWEALFEAKNGGRGYQAGEKIAIKANINGSAVYDDDTSGETDMSYTNPVLLKVLLRSLVEEAGVAPSDITVYDVSRLFPDYMVEMCTEGNLQGVQFVGRNSGVADENAPIVWSYSFSGKVNYLPTCVTEAAYVINLANLKGHSYGITLCGKNHFGSFINGNTMRPPEGANLHQWLTRNEMGIYSPLVDLMADADLGSKTVLYMLDALICAQSEGASIRADSVKWEQAPFNGDFTSSVFFSQDPVAIDSVGADFLMNEPAVTSRNGSLRNNPAVENYLHEAGLVAQAPSGTVYTDSNGHIVENLGVHEHWNNSTEKQYSRNLGKDEGIELICLTESDLAAP